MKKAIMLSVVGILAFVLSSVGIYLAMPTLAPGLVDSTRTRLDSLGLLPVALENHLIADVDTSLIGDIPFDTMDVPIDSGATLADVDQPDSMYAASSGAPAPAAKAMLDDSLRSTVRLLEGLKVENDALAGELEAAKRRLDELIAQQADAAELGKSLGKLEDQQLGNILAELDLNIVELLYLQVSLREQSRLLQNMPPERAARFVKMLVSGPISANEVAARRQVNADGEPEPSN